MADWKVAQFTEGGLSQKERWEGSGTRIEKLKYAGRKLGSGMAQEEGETLVRGDWPVKGEKNVSGTLYRLRGRSKSDGDQSG